VQPVVLDGVFRLWVYGVGHSQLVLHAPPASGGDAVSVLFEGVRAIKLRTSYPGLVIQPVDAPIWARLLDYAGVSEDWRPKTLCLTLPAEEDGSVVCAKATALAGEQSQDRAGWRWPEGHDPPCMEANSMLTVRATLAAARTAMIAVVSGYKAQPKASVARSSSPTTANHSLPTVG
jgi:hypothetical protein